MRGCQLANYIEKMIYSLALSQLAFHQQDTSGCEYNSIVHTVAEYNWIKQLTVKLIFSDWTLNVVVFLLSIAPK